MPITSKIASQMISKTKTFCSKSPFSGKANTKMIQLNNRIKPKLTILKNYRENPIVQGSTYLGGLLGTCYEVRSNHDSKYSSIKLITRATKGLFIGTAIGFSLPSLTSREIGLLVISAGIYVKHKVK